MNDSQPVDSGGGQGSDAGRGPLTKEDILEALRKEDVTDLESFAELVERKNAGKGKGQSTPAMNTFVNPNYVVTT